MRMWMVDPVHMCKDHLLGDHKEIHMLVSAVKRGISLDGYLNGNLLEIHSLRPRHEALVKEMLARGYSHYSDLPDFNVREAGFIDRDEATMELFCRCTRCYDRYNHAPEPLLERWHAYRDSIKQLELLPERVWDRINFRLAYGR